MRPPRAFHTDGLMARLERARELALSNHTRDAIELYQGALEHKPGHLGAALGARLTLPVIYDSSEAARVSRDRVESGLRALHEDIDIFLRQPASECLGQLGWVNFFLAYQGLDDTGFQSQYGDFVARLTATHLPELCRPLPKPNARGRRIRVGFASAYFRQCTVGGYFRGWITGLDRARFETFVYHGSQRQDALTHGIESRCDHFIDLAGPGFGSLGACGERIREDGLDILIYPELGMDAHSFLLASLRLAPVQCAGWGHPVTSGLPGIDCYLSSRDAEPSDAAAHYRESLVLLDGLGVAYSKPSCPIPKQRRDFGLPESKTLYLCPQSLFKLHPDFDPLLARVMSQDAEGILVFFEADHPALTRSFLDRLNKAFLNFDLDIRQRVLVLPYLRHPDYLEVNRLCDVMLDPPYWSGGNTALDALASGLPIVCFEGRFMRGRQSAAMLKRLGLSQLIASDTDDYLSIAHALAHDGAYREAVRARLRARVDTLFDQDAAIASLERFLIQAANA